MGCCAGLTWTQAADSIPELIVDTSWSGQPQARVNAPERKDEYVGEDGLQDFVIPTDYRGYITLFVEGGDGGKAETYDPDLLDFSVGTPDGGPGARTTATFRVGLGEGSVPPGSILRFIVGQKGLNALAERPEGTDAEAYLAALWPYYTLIDFATDSVFAGGGGGGGSAVYFRNPLGDDWQRLAVAGGGGGARASINHFVSGSVPGLPGSVRAQGLFGFGSSAFGFGGYYDPISGLGEGGGGGENSAGGAARETTAEGQRIDWLVVECRRARCIIRWEEWGTGIAMSQT